MVIDTIQYYARLLNRNRFHAGGQNDFLFFRLLFFVCFTFPIVTSPRFGLSCLSLTATTNIPNSIIVHYVMWWVHDMLTRRHSTSATARRCSRNQTLSLLIPEIIIWHAQEHATTSTNFQIDSDRLDLCVISNGSTEPHHTRASIPLHK